MSRCAAVAVAMAIVVVAATACTPRPRVQLGNDCELTTECAAPLACRLGRCREECRSSRDCRAGLVCLRDESGLGACELPDESCAVNTDCRPGLVCLTGRCANGCTSRDECAPGFECVSEPPGAPGGCRSTSLRPCVHSSECAPGEICAPDEYCHRECIGDRDCRDGRTCNLATSVCELADAGAALDATLVDAGAPGPPLPGPYFGCWTFDSLASPSTIPDISGEGRTAVCTGASCPRSVPGHLGDALAFDGSQGLRVPYDPRFTGLSAGYSVTVWFATPPWLEARSLVGVPYLEGDGNALDLYVEPRGVCMATNTGGGWSYACITSAEVEDDAWHHAAAVWDGSIGVLYIDGAEVARGALGVPAFDGHELTLGFDIDYGVFDHGWRGRIDDVCIYQRALAPTEVATLAAM
jgi:hypothetical protein